jgi:hypothetical protein
MAGKAALSIPYNNKVPPNPFVLAFFKRPEHYLFMLLPSLIDRAIRILLLCAPIGL